MKNKEAKFKNWKYELLDKVIENLFYLTLVVISALLAANILIH